MNTILSFLLTRSRRCFTYVATALRLAERHIAWPTNMQEVV